MTRRANHDRSLFLSLHDRNGVLAGEKYALQIHSVQAIPFFYRGCDRFFIDLDGGIGMDHIDAVKTLHHAFSHGLHGTLITNVAMQCPCPAARNLDLARGGLGCLVFHIGKDNHGAFRGEQFRRGTSNAVGGASNDYDFIPQSPVHIASFHWRPQTSQFRSSQLTRKNAVWKDLEEESFDTL